MSGFWNLIQDLIGYSVERAVSRSLSTDVRDDPIYKRNLEKVIERHGALKRASAPPKAGD